MSGVSTIVRPGRAAAGSWKQSDFPKPVESTTSESRPPSTASTARCCSTLRRRTLGQCASSAAARAPLLCQRRELPAAADARPAEAASAVTDLLKAASAIVQLASAPAGEIHGRTRLS